MLIEDNITHSTYLSSNNHNVQFHQSSRHVPVNIYEGKKEEAANLIFNINYIKTRLFRARGKKKYFKQYFH